MRNCLSMRQHKQCTIFKLVLHFWLYERLSLFCTSVKNNKFNKKVGSYLGAMSQDIYNQDLWLAFIKKCLSISNYFCLIKLIATCNTKEELAAKTYPCQRFLLFCNKVCYAKYFLFSTLLTYFFQVCTKLQLSLLLTCL